MPAMLLARLSRVVPLVIVLAVIAIIAYFVLQFRYSPPRAKSILARMFTWITGVLSGAFAIACVYAVLDGNIAVLELFATFLATALIGLIVTRICNAALVKHYPEYKHPAQRTTGTRPYERIVKIIETLRNMQRK